MTNKIIGNGMLAKAFQNSSSNQCLFFCSGVSNSKERSKNEFDREIQTFKDHLDTNYCVIYISSIQSPEINNPYFEHKIYMENLVKSKARRYFIIRLPQVAGITLNKTLFPTFIKHIYENTYFEIFRDAPRSIIDVKHVVYIFDALYSAGKRDIAVDFFPGYTFQPIDLVNEISKFLNTSANIKIINKSLYNNYKDCLKLNSFNHIFRNKKEYLKNIVKEYTPSIVDLIKKEENAIFKKI